MIGADVRQFGGPADEGVRWWFTQLDRGIKRRKKELRRWEVHEDFANGRHWAGLGVDGLNDGRSRTHVNGYGSGDQVTVNKIRSYINQHRASVAYKNPKAKFTPRTPAGYKAVQVPVLGANGTPEMDPQTGGVVTRSVIPAKARENLFNDIISQPLFGLSDFIDRCDMAGILAYGAGAVGYRPQFETALKQDDEQSFKINEDGSLDYSEYELSKVTGLPLKADGRMIRKGTLPVWEEWFIDWVSYKNIIADPDGENDFMQHRWVAVEQVRYLDDVKADKLFKNTKDLTATGDYDDDETRKRYDSWLEGEGDDEKAKTVRLFHVYDFVKNRYLVLADGHGKALRDEVTPKGITHSPLAFLRYQERPGEWYPHPKAADLVPINEWYNNSRRLELVGSKASLRKVITTKKKFDTANLSKLTNDVDMEVVFEQEASAYGQDPIHVFQPPPVNPSVYRASDSANNDFDEMAGSPEARGKATSDTATQSNNLQEGENARNTYERVKMRNFLIVLFKKLNDSIDANMTVERAIQIEDTEGQLFTALVDQDMIAGDFDIDIDIQEMAPSNNAQQAAMRVQLLQMSGSFPHQFSDPVRTRGWCELFNIYDENFINSIVQGAQMQIQAAMIEAQPPMPNAAAPSNEADAVSQSGAGQQVPAMQGAK